MNKNNGFTLVELLAVVIILALTFVFVAPKMASLIKEGNNTEVRLIEQKALVSAKNYVNNYDTNFLNNFIEVGHTKTVYKQDLIDNGLMTIDEISQIEDFRGVQVKLLEDDKLEYTISRLSSTKDYTNEEIIQLIDVLENKNNDLQSRVDSLSTQVSNSNIFLNSYPVGSIYVSTSSTNPGSTYGGTWELVSKKVIDTGWQNFSWTNSTYIGTSQSSYTQNKWRVIDNILYIQVGAGATAKIDTSDTYDIAQIPIKGNTTFNDHRIWNGAVGGSGTTAGFSIKQLDDYITVTIKPHTSTNATVSPWYSTHFTVPLDDSFSFTTGTYDYKYTWKRTV